MKNIIEACQKLREAIQKNQISKSITLAGEIEKMAAELEAKVYNLTVRKQQVMALLEE